MSLLSCARLQQNLASTPAASYLTAVASYPALLCRGRNYYGGIANQNLNTGSGPECAHVALLASCCCQSAAGLRNS